MSPWTFFAMKYVWANQGFACTKNQGWYYAWYLRKQKRPETLELPAFIHIINKNSFDSSCLSKLDTILAEHSVHAWNVISRHFWPLRDSTFSLTIQYKDGGTVKATGYIHFPKEYDEFKNSLVDYTYELFISIQ